MKSGIGSQSVDWEKELLDWYFFVSQKEKRLVFLQPLNSQISNALLGFLFSTLRVCLDTAEN